MHTCCPTDWPVYGRPSRDNAVFGALNCVKSSVCGCAAARPVPASVAADSPAVRMPAPTHTMKPVNHAVSVPANDSCQRYRVNVKAELAIDVGTNRRRLGIEPQVGIEPQAGSRRAVKEPCTDHRRYRCASSATRNRPTTEAPCAKAPAFPLSNSCRTAEIAIDRVNATERLYRWKYDSSQPSMRRLRTWSSFSLSAVCSSSMAQPASSTAV
jgi:hypothetical protein